MGNHFIRMLGLGGLDAMVGYGGRDNWKKWISLPPLSSAGCSGLYEAPVPMAFSEKGLWSVK